ncbi:MAG: radical SAM protein [Pyrinomonadaceae bacterium]|nr:radical SAM protein [Pyrinomonadaceae bacterium]
MNSILSIDIYLTYQCNLRCKHCFLGTKLNEATHFDFLLLQKLIKNASSWGTEEITFLGGEPTLYPYLTESIKLVQDQGIRARIVTNGHRSFEKFLNNYDGDELPHICFSIDGASADTHDSIRGKKSFEHLLNSISLANQKGYTKSGIISINKQNSHDCDRILELCTTLGLQYVNIHYVTNRGFATEETVLSIDEWLSVVKRIELKSKLIDLDVRVERTFTPNKEFAGGCAVREQSNLMFFPDGKVFMCAMFIDIENIHSFTWTHEGLVPNQSKFTEATVCKSESLTHCPAIALVNPFIQNQAATKGYAVRCIYDKSCIRQGSEVIDSHSMHLPNKE